MSHKLLAYGQSCLLAVKNCVHPSHFLSNQITIILVVSYLEASTRQAKQLI